MQNRPIRGQAGQFNPADHNLTPGTPQQQAAAQRGYSPVAGPSQDRDNGGTEGLQEDSSPKHYAVPASNQPATDATVAAEVKRVVDVLRSGSRPSQREAANLIEKAVAQYKEGSEPELVTS